MDGETVFAVLLGAALAVFSLVMAGYPVLRDAFFRPAHRGDGDAGPAEPGDDGDVGLAAIYDSIDTLELEYQLGNLPEPEYRRQLQAYRLEAAAVVKAQVWSGGICHSASALPPAGAHWPQGATPRWRLARSAMRRFRRGIAGLARVAA